MQLCVTNLLGESQSGLSRPWPQLHYYAPAEFNKLTSSLLSLPSEIGRIVINLTNWQQTYLVLPTSRRPGLLVDVALRPCLPACQPQRQEHCTHMYVHIGNQSLVPPKIDEMIYVKNVTSAPKCFLIHYYRVEL